MDHVKGNGPLLKAKIELPDGEWHKGEAEWIWIQPRVGGTAVVRNVPFFAKGLSFGDIVRIESKDGSLNVIEVVEHSGHSTYRIFVPGGKDTPELKKLLTDLGEAGCEYEVATKKLIAIDVLPRADIYKAYEILSNAESRGLIDFEEGHCGHPLRD